MCSSDLYQVVPRIYELFTLFGMERSSVERYRSACTSSERYEYDFVAAADCHDRAALLLLSTQSTPSGRGVIIGAIVSSIVIVIVIVCVWVLSRLFWGENSCASEGSARWP